MAIQYAYKMKRYGNLYPKIYDIDNLRRAHKNAKKGKGWYKEVKLVDENPEEYLARLQEMLINKTYHTSEYKTFIRNDTGKERLIYKLPYFPDRICQWAILQIIEPYLLKTFTDDTYSAIPEKGIHLCLYKLKHAMQTDISGCQYCLKLDVKKYYPSIDHAILKMQYRRLFKDKDLLWLLDEIIDSTPGGVGIPIGNYLSQYSGNLYLSSFDHWIKEVKRVKHYFRYMDDIVIFGENKSGLHKLKDDIAEYFRMNLKLEIKENWQVFPSYIRGVDYVGYRVFLDYVLLRKRTCKRMKKKLNRINKDRMEGRDLNYSKWCAINSYKGWLMHCDSYRLQQKYIAPIQEYADAYYQRNIKSKNKKGGKKA